MPAICPFRNGSSPHQGSKKKPRAASKKTAARKSARSRRYSPAERAKILAAAKREGLSGPVAAKKFGISQLTFYTWSKKAGTSTHGKASSGPRQTTARRRIAGGYDEEIRRAVRLRVAELSPGIVESEIEAALGEVKRGRR